MATEELGLWGLPGDGWRRGGSLAVLSAWHRNSLPHRFLVLFFLESNKRIPVLASRNIPGINTTGSLPVLNFRQGYPVHTPPARGNMGLSLPESGGGHC